MQTAHPIETDALIVGAGPVGLFQVFQLGLLDIKAHVVDSLPHAGGQPVELYPDKPIFDIPAVPMCSGRELAASLLKQIEPFGATLHLGQEVTQVERQADGRFAVATSRGVQFLARTLVIAAGVGAFQPRKLKVEGVDRFEGKQLFYRVDDAAQVVGKNVIVLGGDEAAISRAVEFAASGAASVTLIHRRDVLQAPAELMAQFEALRSSGKVTFVVGQPTGFEEKGGALTGLDVTDPDARTHRLPVDAIYAFFGLSPKLGPVAEWGLAMERKQLTVNTESYATNEPGIFAVGDINTYPGKKKLIVCGFHECVLAAFGAAAIVFPGKAVALQYTTTSPRLHKLLGYEPPVT